jgi:hypothetical protein
MQPTTIYRQLLTLFEGVEAEAANRSTRDAMGWLEDLMRAGDDPVMQGRCEDIEGAQIVMDVLRGFFATWYQRLQVVRDAEIEREMRDWEEYGRDEYLQQKAWDAREFSRGEE